MDLEEWLGLSSLLSRRERHPALGPVWVSLCAWLPLFPRALCVTLSESLSVSRTVVDRMAP